MKWIASGKTVVIIAHRLSTIRSADNIIVMDEGSVIAKGNPNQIKNNKKVLEAYLGD